jgi:beta-glucanase (GH16 family)
MPTIPVSAHTNSRGILLAGATAYAKGVLGMSSGETLIGSSAADGMRSSTRGDTTMKGGAGDDTYFVNTSTDVVEEGSIDGIDTVVSYVTGYILPANVENLYVDQTSASGIGNSQDNLIVGGNGSQTLDGAAGDDVLTGGEGADIFVAAAGKGNDVIADFKAREDKIRLDGSTFRSFDELRASFHQVGQDTIIGLGNGQTLTLLNVDSQTLTSDDFYLPLDRSQLRLTFGDDFNSLAASSTGVGTKWKTALGINVQARTIQSNKEEEYYADAADANNPFSIDSGILDISASQGANPLGLNYVSGVLTTAKSFAQLYGYFEIRCKLPDVTGMWPAFWMLNQDGTWPSELDIFEVLGNDAKTAYMSALGSLNSDGTRNGTTNVIRTADLSANFHIFGVDWSPDYLTYYIDGQAVARLNTPAEMSKPMYMVVNLAVGDTGSWPGSPDASNPTAHLLVDYVRAYATSSTVSTSTVSSTVSPVGVATTVKLVTPSSTMIAQTTTATTITSPAEATAAGGVYTLVAGSGDTYDFSSLGYGGVTIDASNMSATSSHRIIGTSYKDVVNIGGRYVAVSAGAGDDVIRLGGSGGRVMGGDGNDTFLFVKGQLSGNSSILDFHTFRSKSEEHDVLRFEGFGNSARLDWLSGSGSTQFYQVTDEDVVSPTISITMAGGVSSHLSAADVLFADSSLPLVNSGIIVPPEVVQQTGSDQPVENPNGNQPPAGSPPGAPGNGVGPITPGTTSGGSASQPIRFLATDTLTGANASVPGSQYVGPVSYLDYEAVFASSTGVAVAAIVPNVFIKAAGNSALQALDGQNVLDGGPGSNYLTGGSGHDTYFADARGNTPVWDTIVNFKPNDMVTLWGFVAGTSTYFWSADEGAQNAKGATLHADLGSGTVTASVTLAGYDLAAAHGLTVSTGNVGGNAYLAIVSNGK